MDLKNYEDYELYYNNNKENLNIYFKHLSKIKYTFEDEKINEDHESSTRHY